MAAAPPAPAAAIDANRGIHRRLQYGTLGPLPVVINTTNATQAALLTNAGLATLVANYSWRLDHTFTDITYVEDLASQTDTTTLLVAFEAFGSTSGIVGYSGCAGTAPLVCDLGPIRPLPLTDPDALTVQTARITGLSIPPGSFAYATIFALSGAGEVASVSTDGVLVDNRPPDASVAMVLDVGRYYEQPPTNPGAGRSEKGGLPARDIDCDVAGAGIGAVWRGFAAPIGLDHYEWCVGLSPLGQEILPWTSVGLTTTVYNATLNAPPGSTVYVSVAAVDRIGQYAALSSDGFVVLADATGVAGEDGTFVCHGSPLLLSALSLHSPNGLLTNF